MTPSQSLFHALLRPCVLQILRAQGFHSARPGVVDSFTALAADYLRGLCEATAHYTALNGSEAGPTAVDVRMALEYFRAVMPEVVFEEEQWMKEEKCDSMNEFTKWFQGARHKEIKRVALDGDDENDDYLNALAKKHNKAGEDSKYNGTVLGKGNEHGDVAVEGGEVASIQMWQEMRIKKRQAPPIPLPVSPAEDSRPPSSGLSSLGDRTIGDDDMDLS